MDIVRAVVYSKLGQDTVVLQRERSLVTNPINTMASIQAGQHDMSQNLRSNTVVLEQCLSYERLISSSGALEAIDDDD